MKRFFSHLCWSAACAALVACGGGADKGGNSPTPAAPALQAIAVSPVGLSLAVGSTQTFTAVGTYSDGSTAAVSTGVVWGSSNAAVTINAGTGLAVAVSPGTATVSASVGTVVGTSVVATTAVPVVGTPYKSVASGHFHTLAVRNDGRLYAWGQNRSGQLGDATLVDKTTPTRIGADATWTQVAAGEYHSLAIKNDGTLWAWGLNIDGQLGMGVGDITQRTLPVQVGADADWLAVAAGKNHSLALKTDFTLWAWGRNASGQLGIAALDVTNRYVPTAVGADTDWVAVAAGADHSLALKSTGALWAWGLNTDGQLGVSDSTAVRKEAPTAVDATNTPNTQWVAAAAGGAHTLAVRNDGALFVWGSNAHSQLGNGLAGSLLTPTRLGLDNGWQWVAAGGAHSVARQRNGSLWAWGSNSQGQLGNGTVSSAPVPIQLGTGLDWSVPFVGADTTFVLRNSNQLWGWGRNTEGQQGNGNLLNVLSPAVVP